jgi:hypothetical protein
MVRNLVFVQAVLLAALPAHAGPWGRADGAIYGRVSVSRGEVEGLLSNRLDLYGEYGLGHDWTASLKYERVTFDDFSEFTAHGWRATARRTFELTEQVVWSIEGGVLQGEAIGGAAGCQSFGAETRAGLGRSFKMGDKKIRHGFMLAETAMRAHSDGCQRLRLELGYGREIAGNIWLISQAWFDHGSFNATSQKYQAEYLWRTGLGDFSVGTLTELGGEFEETSVFLAVSRRY